MTSACLGLQRGASHCQTRENKRRSFPFLPTHDCYPNTLSLNARQTTAFWWPLYSLLISPVSTHHSLARLSEEAGTESEERSGIYHITLYTFLKIILRLSSCFVQDITRAVDDK